MSVALELVSETYNEIILERLSFHFGGATDAQLFEHIFLWRFAEPDARIRLIADEASEAFRTYQREETLPEFFGILYMILEVRETISEADCLPYGRMYAPKFWRMVFCRHFGAEPADDPVEVEKDLDRERKCAVLGNTDKRWDDLFREGLPMCRKLKTASS